MNRRNYYYRKKIETDELDDLQDNIENADKNIIKDFIGFGIWSGLTLTKKNPGTSDAIFVISAGVGYDQSGNRVAVEANQEIDLASYLPGAGLIKSLAIVANFTRYQSVQELDGYDNYQYFHNDESFAISIIEGGTAVSDPAVATLSASNILINDINIDSEINYTLSTSRVIRTSETIQEHFNNIDNPHLVGMSQLSDNQLNGDMDANSKRIRNLPVPANNDEPARHLELTTLSNALDAEIAERLADLKFIDVTDSLIMQPGKKYLVTGDNVELQLPTSADTGEVIEIFCKNMSKITQSDTEHLISYFNKYFSTKGNNGFLSLYQKNHIEMIYKGVEGYIDLPGTKLSDPATLPVTNAFKCTFSHNGDYLVVTHQGSPYITIYKRSGDTFTKLADPAVLPSSYAQGCAFSYDDVYLAIGNSLANYITIYKRSGDTFTKLADPDVLPTNQCKGMKFSYDGVYLLVATSSSPYIIIYKRSGDTFTKLVNPTTLPQGECRSCDISYDGVYFAVVGETSPYLNIYKRSGDTFTKLANPATLPGNSGNSCSFSYDGKYLVIAYTTSSPYIIIYKRSGDTFTKLTDPAVFPSTHAQACSFSYDSKYLVVSYVASPFIIIYKVNEDNFTKLPDLSSLPASAGTGCSFSYDGKYLALTTSYNSPYITIYKNLFSADKTWYVKRLITLYDQDKEYMFK